MAAPWLIPVHTDPWPTLYSEVLAGLVVIPVAVWAIIVRRSPLGLDAIAVGFALAALVPLLQAAAGLFLFPAEAPIVSLYLIGIFLTAAIARRSEESLPNRLPDALFAGLVIAALVSSGLALAQWLQLSWDPFMPAIPAGIVRTIANVGQANELSTLLIWGLIGLWWAHVHGRIGGFVSVFASMLLLAGVASTQSRTGWLAISLVLFVAILSPRRLESAKHRIAFSGLGLWFVMLVLVWPRLTKMFSGGSTLGLEDQLRHGQRPEIWNMMFDGIWRHPWFGYGWNQGRLVQLGELPNYADLKIGVQHAHNLVLDLIIWNGLPLGLLFSVLLGYWFWWQLRRARTPAQILLLLAVSTFILHALLELPHCKSFFLVPVALMMGILNARSMLPVLLRLPRGLVALSTIFFTVTLVQVAIDYRAIELDLQSYRIRMARIQQKVPPSVPNIQVLSALEAALLNMRIEPREGMAANELERLRVTADRYPIEVALLRYAEAAALNHQSKVARISLARLCLLFPQDTCDLARVTWGIFLNEHSEIEPVPFPF